MPPSVAGPLWDFGSWDVEKRSTPPWQYRHFWYHDHSNGEGDRLVIAWRYAFDEGGYMVVSGDIYRVKDMLAAIKLAWSFHESIDRDNGWGPDGVFIFFGNRRICESSIHGAPLPPELQNLPDGRWL